MRKVIAIVLAVALVAVLVPVIALAGNGNGNGNGKQPGIDFNGPHYNLNIIGKKADWSGGGSYDNPNRHTMFVPEDTTGYTTPNGEDGITIWMTQGSDWAVLDGNAFDDGECAFQLAPGKYKVYIVAKAKPGGATNITGWVYYEETGDHYFSIGTVKVTKSKWWKDATHIFYVSSSEDPFGMVPSNGLGMWVFDYLAWLAGQPDVTDTAYFWQYDNKGNKLVKVRFYPD